MEAIKLLFSSWTGILSIFTVVFATGFIAYIGVVMARLSKGESKE
jgi:hypothetical protein